MTIEYLPNIHIKPATKNEIHFIIDTIIEAEKSGRDIIGTSKIFNFSEKEYCEMIYELLSDDSKNYEYSLDSFLVAFDGDKAIGAFGAWIEAPDGVSSSIMKINAFISLMEREKIIECQNRLRLLSGKNFHRTEGALQFEFAYVIPEYTGKGILQEIMKRQVQRYKNEGNNFNKAQVVLAKENIPAIKSYLRFGFQVVDSIIIDEELSNYFSFKERVLMECPIEILQKYF